MAGLTATAATHVSDRFARRGNAVMATSTITADARMIHAGRGPSGRAMTVIAVLVCCNMGAGFTDGNRRVMTAGTRA